MTPCYDARIVEATARVIAKASDEAVLDGPRVHGSGRYATNIASQLIVDLYREEIARRGLTPRD